MEVDDAMILKWKFLKFIQTFRAAFASLFEDVWNISPKSVKFIILRSEKKKFKEPSSSLHIDLMDENNGTKWNKWRIRIFIFL